MLDNAVEDTHYGVDIARKHLGGSPSHDVAVSYRFAIQSDLNLS